MTAIAADALLLPGRVEASALELKRPGVSYTADTLRQLREQEPDAQLWLLMGADMFLSFQNWREPDVIARLAGICAFARTPDAPEQALCAQARRLERELGARVRLVHSPDIVDISSTRLRALLAAGRDGNSWPRRCTAISSARASTAYTMTGSVCPTGNCGPVPTP